LDAPKDPAQQAAVLETRELFQSINWTKPRIIIQETNQGLARSVVQGVHCALEDHEAVILLEDDCVPQAHFFDFVFDSLERYRDDMRVFGISGYSIPLPEDLRKSYPHDLYFYPRMGSWGWATWKTRWKKDNRNLAQLTIQAIQQGVDLEQGGLDVPNALGHVMLGMVKDTWTLPWLVNVYLHHACYVYPTVSHIENIGLDGTGVHCGKTDKYNTALAVNPAQRFPAEPFFEPEICKLFAQFQSAPDRQFSNEQLMEIANKVKLKVVHVCTHDHGGAGVAALRLHQGLKVAGVESSMLVLSKQSQDPDVHLIGNLDAFNKQWHDVLVNHPNRRQDLEYFSDAICNVDLSRNRIFAEADVINLHWVAGILNHSTLASMLQGKPAVWTLHDMNAFTGGCHYNWDCEKFMQNCGACPQLGSTQENDISAQAHIQKKTGYRGSNLHVVSPSEWLAGEARRSSLLRDRPVHVLPNGFPLDVFKPANREEVRDQLKIGQNRKVVLFGCESLLNVRKGFRYMLEAIALLAKDGHEPPLFCFFGSLPQGLNLPGETLSLGIIRDPSMLSAVYSMADVFVISSLQDNLPNVVPESLGCGTPVVGFHLGGIPDMIHHERTGYLVKSMNGLALATGIRWVLDNVNPSMRIRCRQYAEACFSQAVQAENYLGLYKRILLAPFEGDSVGKPSLDLPAKAPPKLINLGCGSRFHSAWENFDFASNNPAVKVANLRKGIPLANDYADAIYQSHVLEHFPKAEAPQFIAECFRVLRPGGVLRVAIPDLEPIAKLYLQYLQDALRGIPEADDRYDWMTMELLDQLVRNRPGGSMLEWWTAPELRAKEFIIERTGEETRRVLDSIRNGARPPVFPEPSNAQALGEFRLSGEIHQWMYDRFSLARLLKDAGFVGVRQVTAQESAIERFSSFQLDTNEQGGTRKPDSLFMEAQKPQEKTYEVTAIVSVYNAERFMKHRLDNLLSQTLGDKLEILVIDAFSPQNERSVVLPYLAQHDNIKYIRLEEREGLYASWARGCKLARGKYITNANADDVLRFDALELLAKELDEHPESGLAYGDFWVTNRDNQNFRNHVRIGYALRPDYDPRLMLWGCYMGPQPMWRKSIHAKIGHFDPSYKAAGDYEFWCRIVAAGYSMRHVAQFLGTYQHNPSGIVNSNQNATAVETQKVRELYGNTIVRPSPQPIFDHYRFNSSLPMDRHGLIMVKAGSDPVQLDRALQIIWRNTFFPYRIGVVDDLENQDVTDRLREMMNQGVVQFIVAPTANVRFVDPSAAFIVHVLVEITALSSTWLEVLAGILDQEARVEKLFWDGDARERKHQVLDPDSLLNAPVQAYLTKPPLTKGLFLMISEPGFVSLKPQ
jgi:glycosyltransferase involved in cell wall biosynthesis